MGAWAERMESRIAALDERLVTQERQQYPAPAARRDEELGRSIDRLSDRWVACRIGDVTAGRRIVAEGTMTLGSYLAGGTALTPPVVPGRFDVRAQPYPHAATLGTTLFFVWDETNDKMLVYDAGGAEIAPASDLSAVTNWPIEVIGEHGPEYSAYRASGPETLLRAELEVLEDVAVSTSNYWRLGVRTRNAVTEDGVPVGTRYSTASLRLDARSAVTLYPVAQTDPGIALAEDDRIVLYAEETGVGPALEDLTLWLLLRRNVR